MWFISHEKPSVHGVKCRQSKVSSFVHCEDIRKRRCEIHRKNEVCVYRVVWVIINFKEVIGSYVIPRLSYILSLLPPLLRDFKT